MLKPLHIHNTVKIYEASENAVHYKYLVAVYGNITYIHNIQWSGGLDLDRRDGFSPIQMDNCNVKLNVPFYNNGILGCTSYRSKITGKKAKMSYKPVDRDMSGCRDGESPESIVICVAFDGEGGLRID